MPSVNSDCSSVLGTGLIALDLIMTPGGSVTHSIGGTCGNVLTVLSSQGINARPVGHSGVDIAADLIRQHLAAVGSDSSLVLRKSGVKTPRIVELAPGNGSLRHRFAFTCPECNTRLPRNLALREEEVRNIAIDWSNVSLFFFDRATPAGIFLALSAREAGVTVMFEPPKSQVGARLRSAIAAADIVLYSSQDYKGGILGEFTTNLRLLVETQGRKGLRYRRQSGDALSSWQHIPAFDPVDPRDLAGAGDWCTAGFIYELVRKGKDWHWTQLELEAALLYGQALATISVCFVGPLGALFALTKVEIDSAVQHVLEEGRVPEWALLQGDEERAFGPAWPLDVRPIPEMCEVCLLEMST